MVLAVALSALAGPAGLVGSAGASSHAVEISDCGLYNADQQAYVLSSSFSAAGNTPCIRISGSNVILDGNNNTITGNAEEDTGVLVQGSAQQNVTVRNLDVTDFRTGVQFNSVPDSAIENVDVTDANRDGVQIDASNVDVRRSTVDNGGLDSPGDGIDASGTSDHSVSIEDTVVRNASIGVRADQPGLVSDDLTVESNDVSGLQVGGPSQVHTDLVAVDNDANGVIVQGELGGPGPTIQGTQTEIIQNGADGIFLVGGDGTTIQGPGINVSDNGNFGINTDERSDVTISGVQLQDNARGGVRLEDSHDVLIEDVAISGGGDVEGGSVGIEVDGTQTGDVTIRNAEITNVPTDGIFADYGSEVTIEGSETHIADNGGDGVRARSCSGECGPTTVDISGGTVTNNAATELRADSVATIHATGVNVGASTAADTTIDAELYGSSLTSLATVDSPVSAPPEGQAALDRYVLLDSASEGPSYADVALNYADGDVDGLNESTVSMLSMDFDAGTEWNLVDDTTLDDGANTVAANVTVGEATGYGLFAEPVPESTPEPESGSSGDSSGPSGSPAFAIEEVDAPETVEPGDDVAIEVTVANEGDGDGIHEATVRAGEDDLASENVFVAAGESDTITLTVTLSEAGEHELTVSNQTAVTVAAASQEQATPTDTATAPATVTSTATGAPTPDPAETPTEAGGGLPLLPIALLVLVAAGGAGVVLWHRQ